MSTVELSQIPSHVGTGLPKHAKRGFSTLDYIRRDLTVTYKLVGNVKSTYEPSGHQAGTYPDFRSMKQLGVFLLPPGWDASPSQGYPQQ